MNQRDHRKLLIVDGRTAFVGGINISSVYSAGSLQPGLEAAPRRQPAVARHRTCRSKGPVVAEFQKLFLATWDKQKGEPLAPRELLSRAGRARARKSCAPSAARPTSRTA